MPICEADPWRLQYFEGIPCPEDVNVPTEDGDAWSWFPQHKWLYNKLAVAESQGMLCGPHGLEPPAFPVFSKPVFNMRGMGTGSRVFRTAKEYKAFQRPGHIWMPLLSGEHVSTDIAVVNGEPVWWRHTTGAPLEGGMFDYWTVLAEDRPEIEEYVAAWLRKNLATYTGMVNVETIGAKIIEAHLRFADQWPDLYGGRPWVEALVRLYAEGRWDFDDSGRREGYSVVLFGGHGLQYRHPPASVLEEIRAEPEVTSVQVTFHEDRPPSWHSMPPGGFRLAIVNTWDLEAGRRAREKLALSFWSTQQLLPKRGRRSGS
ncbi:hypothetical protein [Afifella sp. IM 167]|uniref:hypothetical protein n=1 Tax=Afifella sp. IM 167 TaxID=2033586 RepID=UPI001CC99137|nr:hypothetical protein [Afifella sp. IM 167]MBZ8132102.1 hypothetical protein [Afifella sp. IM 167]